LGPCVSYLFWLCKTERVSLVKAGVAIVSSLDGNISEICKLFILFLENMDFYKFVTIGSAFRIMSGGLAEQSNVIDLGDIILEVNNIPIHSAEDLSALVRHLVIRVAFRSLVAADSVFTKLFYALFRAEILSLKLRLLLS
jgi:hypothetical protein